VLTWPRNAVDFGIMMINNAQCAQLFVGALTKKISMGSGLKPYEEGRVLPEVKPWSSFAGYV
jgi:carbamoyl-phosphate synthase large subunit